jgi:hypothetical protein
MFDFLEREVSEGVETSPGGYGKEDSGFGDLVSDRHSFALLCFATSHSDCSHQFIRS